MASGTGLWVRFLILVLIVAVMVGACYAHIRSVCDTYEAWTPVMVDGADFTRFTLDDVSYTEPGVVEAVNIEPGKHGAAGIVFRAVAPGETDITFGDDQLAAYWHMQVRDGAVIAGGVNFSGWGSIHLCLCIFFGVLALLFASGLIRLQRIRWFGYAMVACCGGMLFCLFQCVLFTFLLVNGSLAAFGDMVCQITVMADYFVMVTLIPMAIAALLVSASNIALIRHHAAEHGVLAEGDRAARRPRRERGGGGILHHQLPCVPRIRVRPPGGHGRGGHGHAIYVFAEYVLAMM